MNWVGNLVQNFVDHDDTVLDLGCGPMHPLLGLNKCYPDTRLQCREILGVDIHLQHLKEIVSHNVETLRADLKRCLPFQNKSFDITLLLDILEHLTVQTAEHLVAEASRVTKKMVLAITPRNYRSNVQNVHALNNPYQYHKSLISGSWLKRHGFKVTKPRRKMFNPFQYSFAWKEIE